MRRATIDEKKKCPKCGRTEQQVKVGFNNSGTQRCRCKVCSIRYTIDPKKIAYPEEIRQAAIKTYFSGVSGRGVGHIFHMSKANVYNWIKKMNGIESKAEKVSSNLYELDELYWLIEKKPRTETRENTYVFIMVSRVPRQLIGFDVSMEKSSKYIQGIVDHAPDADFYCTDGYIGYWM